MTLLSAALPLLPLAEPATADAAERSVVVRACEGDAAAFRWLFDRHAAPVRRFLRDLLRDGAAADEATQDTFVRAFDRLATLREQDRFRPWVLGIARNVAREAQRRHRVRGWVEALSARFSAGDDGGVEDDAPAEGTPESRLLDRERFARLDAALAALSADRRAVLLLRFDHALSCAEVAATLGWSVAKVKVEVHRARKQLRSAIAEEEPR